MLFSNNNNIPLPLAVWLAADDYDFIGGKNRVSVTSLIKPTRRFVLGARVPLVERDMDVSDFIKSRMGHAFHDSIESAWKNHYKTSLDKLGYPQHVIDAVRINPDPLNQEPNTVPVYIEQRSEREINGYTISGKFDMAIEGELYDTKSTSVYSWISGKKDDDYIKQGSIYRWIDRDRLTGDHIHIQHIFTDYSKAMARSQKNYPPNILMNSTYPLMSLGDTEAFIIEKTSAISQFWSAPDDEIPHCTDEELWRSEPKYKYYANPDNVEGKSTKNFDNLADANKFRAEKGKGVVLTELGKVKACLYCPAFKACKQKDLYSFDD